MKVRLHPVTSAVLLALLFVGLALGLRLARSEGYLEAEAAARGLQVMIGLMLAAYANLTPKRIEPLTGSMSFRAQAARQAVRRVGGWSMTLAGLAYAALAAFAPMPEGRWLGMAAVFASLILTVGFAIWKGVMCRPVEDASAR